MTNQDIINKLESELNAANIAYENADQNARNLHKAISRGRTSAERLAAANAHIAACNEAQRLKYAARDASRAYKAAVAESNN